MDKRKQKESVDQWGLIRSNRVLIINKEKGKILYDISTEEGQSGASIINIDASERLSIIGIHKGGVLTEINGSYT